MRLPQNMSVNGVKSLNTVSILFWGLSVLFFTGCQMAADRHNCTGKQAFLSGQIPQAINAFQKSIQSNPNNPDAYYNLASTYAALGKQNKNPQWVDQAEQLFRQAISLNGQHIEAHRSLAALLIETGRETFAFDLLNGWRDRSPTSSEPLIELARLYEEYGDTRRATDLLSDALKLASNNTRALKAMGHVRELQGQYDLAIQNYQRVVQIDPRETAVANRIASLQPKLANMNGIVQQPDRYGAANPFLNR